MLCFVAGLSILKMPVCDEGGQVSKWTRECTAVRRWAWCRAHKTVWVTKVEEGSNERRESERCDATRKR